MFLAKKYTNELEDYQKLLKIFGSLSKLYSASENTYLGYRIHENIFCKAFRADNQARNDIAVDAVKDNIGIGLKTFVYKDSQYEKIAEFNELKSQYNHLGNSDLANFIAQARNECIDLATNLLNLKHNIYHCVARREDNFIIYESEMPKIVTQAIQVTSENEKTMNFTDGHDIYRFNYSKSTLFKKFTPNLKTVLEFKIEVIDNPFRTIIDLLQEPQEIEALILPLYSSIKGKYDVSQKSGLNQWNAGGRERHHDEVYIPIPAWIHKRYPNFLPPRNQNFNLILPDKQIMSAKVCQDNSKALMSNPNKVLGAWLLRDVFKLSPRQILTYNRLLQINCDSVEIGKINPREFSINFKKIGSFEAFKRQSKGLNA